MLLNDPALSLSRRRGAFHRVAPPREGMGFRPLRPSDRANGGDPVRRMGVRGPIGVELKGDVRMFGNLSLLFHF